MSVRYDPINKPGISNLINIYASLTGLEIADVEVKFKDSNYGNFKKCVADVVCDFLEKIQEKYNTILGSEELEKILKNGAEEVSKLSKDKFEIMKNKIGLYR